MRAAPANTPVAQAYVRGKHGGATRLWAGRLQSPSMSASKPHALVIAALITEEVRKYAAEQGVSEQDALQKEMEQRAKEFVEAGAEVYSKV